MLKLLNKAQNVHGFFQIRAHFKVLPTGMQFIDLLFRDVHTGFIGKPDENWFSVLLAFIEI